MIKSFIKAAAVFVSGFALCAVTSGGNLASTAKEMLSMPTTSQAQKVIWEYTSTNKEKDLNKLGAESWELVGISDSVAISGGLGSSSPSFYLKRAK